MGSMKLTKKEALEILDGDEAHYIVVEDKQIGRERWTLSYRLVIFDPSANVYYITHYSAGANEQGDTSPWEYDDEVEFQEAEAYSEVVIKYRVKK